MPRACGEAFVLLTSRWVSHFVRIFLCKWTVCRLELYLVYFYAIQRSQNPKSIIISGQKLFCQIVPIMKRVVICPMKSKLNEIIEKSVSQLYDFDIYLKFCLGLHCHLMK